MTAHLPEPLTISDLDPGETLWSIDLEPDGTPKPIKGTVVSCEGSWMRVKMVADGRIVTEQGCRWQRSLQGAVLQRLEAACYAITFARSGADRSAALNRVLRLAWSLNR